MIIEINPATLSMFSLKPVDVCNYLNQLNFDGFIISETDGLENLRKSEINQTMNVLFIHHEKVNVYPDLFN